MNLLNRMMSYDKTKFKNQENCNCVECDSKTKDSISVKIKNITFVDDFLIKVENYRSICKEKEFLTVINLKYWWKDEKTKTFIWKAMHIHDYKYDYSNVVYIKAEIPVEIICKVNGHKPFSQTPSRHLQGRGCQKCAYIRNSNNRRKTIEEFIKEAKQIYGDKYDYSKVKYIDTHTEVIIICPIHGDFSKTPKAHLNGEGCQLCSIKKRRDEQTMTLGEFIEKANNIYGIGTYDYSKVIYVNNYTEVTIICHKHGEFLKTPNAHLSSQGCPKCKNNYKGEIAIRNFLTEYKIEFKEQKKFDDCKDKRQLPFDFYIPLYNLCIEFDGEGHFKPIKRSKEMTDKQAEENLNYIQKHDKIKTNYCKNNGINLLRIRYDENVEEKLKEYFQKYGIIKEQTIFDLMS